MLNAKNKMVVVSFILFVILIFAFNAHWLYIQSSNHVLTPFEEFFSNGYFLLILGVLALFYTCIFIICFCKKKYIFFQIVSFIILSVVFFKFNFLYELGRCRCANYIITFIFSIVFFIVRSSKLENFLFRLKFVALFLLIVLIFNFTFFNLKMRRTINDFEYYIENSYNNIIYVSEFKEDFNWIFGNEQILPFLSLVVQNLFGQKIINKIMYIDSDDLPDNMDNLFNISKEIKRLPKLQKFGIIYGKDLLQKIENREKKEKNVQDFDDL
jgi:hypothetical protein